MGTKPRIAFIGLGAMGMGMAIHLLADDFHVTGFDVNLMALETLLAMGGNTSSSPREYRDVFFAESTGAVYALRQNATIILCSTVAPGFPQSILNCLHQMFHRRDVQLIDCPVSGGTKRAAEGSLTVLSSGPADALLIAQPILESMSANLFEIEGGLGAANKVKLINQHLAGIHIAASAEAMGLAATLGLNSKEVYEIVLKSPAHSWMFEDRVLHMLVDDWTPHSALKIFVKDMRIVTSEGLLQNFPLYMATATERLYQFASRIGYGEEDDSGLVRIFLAQSPSLVSAAVQNQRYVPENAWACDLICQLLEIVHTLAAIEALALGQALSLSISNLVQIIGNAADTSKPFIRVTEALGGTSAPRDTVEHLRHKLKEVVTVAQAYNYPLQITSTSLQLLQQAVAFGMGEEGEAALFRLWTTSIMTHEP